MICIQLWRDNSLAVQLGPGLETALPDEDAADRAIDALITEVHSGKYGKGQFALNAFHANDLGAHLETYWDSAPFDYPRESRAA